MIPRGTRRQGLGLFLRRSTHRQCAAGRRVAASSASAGKLTALAFGGLFGDHDHGLKQRAPDVVAMATSTGIATPPDKHSTVAGCCAGQRPPLITEVDLIQAASHRQLERRNIDLRQITEDVACGMLSARQNDTARWVKSRQTP